MRTFYFIVALLLFWQPVFSTDGVIYPEDGTFSFTWTVKADTVTVVIRNAKALPANRLFVTEHSRNQPKLLQCLVDGSPSTGVLQETDQLFPYLRTTRWLISSFKTQVLLKYYVPDYIGGQLHWAAYANGGYFGVATSANCCRNRRGNVNNDSADLVDLTDLAMLVSVLEGGSASLQCPEEANVNGDPSGLVDLGDLSLLIHYLSAGGVTLPLCPAQ